MTVRVILELEPEAAAGILRFAEKVSHDMAKSVLYAHKGDKQRNEQAAEIIAAFSVLENALTDAGVRSWPWIEAGSLATNVSHIRGKADE